jgi:predicted ATP-binding protein involved in virulence
MASPLGRLFCRKSYGGKSELESDRFYVKTLTLENFRCFEKVELGPFDQHFNLLVGTNGAGKSSVLLALANLFRQLGQPDLLGPGEMVTARSDIRFEHRVGADGVTALKLHTPASLSAYFSHGSVEYLAFESFGATTPPYGTAPLEIARTLPRPHEFWRPGLNTRAQIADKPLSLIALYSVSRQFRSRASEDKPDRGLPNDRLNGLAGWFEAGINAVFLREWVKDQTLAALQSLQLEFADRNPGAQPIVTAKFRQLRLLHEAIVSAVEDATKIEYDSDAQDIVVQFQDGSRKDFSGLSDGQRALIGLVVDIVRRACLLNAPFLGAKTLLETTGLVLIDELDLHLHPRWQRRLVADLKRIFPKIQFFATTHSPQIIGEAKPEEIVMLTPTGQKRPMASYGMDSNWVLECVMEAEGRDPEIAKQIKTVFQAIEDSRFEDARRMLAELREVIGEAPDIVAAESYIWNVEHDGEEAAE